MNLKITYLLIFISVGICSGNNLKVENIELKEQNSANNTVKVEFDLSWENSWRTNSGPKNYDAAWIFIKYRTNSGPWTHARLEYSNGINDGHTAPSGSTIHTASDQTGCFIFRSQNGSGNNDWDNVQLLWNYDSVDDDAQVDVQVFAIEMVYIPEEAFYLGGGSGDEAGKFYSRPYSNSSYIVTSEAAITVGTSSGNLYYDSDGDQLGPIPAIFPKGFEAFYTMKYETTEGQWLAFFNSLSPDQKTNRDVTSIEGKNSQLEVSGNTIAWTGSSNPATTSAPERAMAYTTSGDFMAYMDWSGLRPMTELEYEKACRGPAPKVANDYAWGNANILTGIVYALENEGTSTEYINNPGTSTGNANYSITNPGRPIRVGALAASAINKNREETGASYYGVMEMSGNQYERVISVGNPRGRLFRGTHGNGIISSSGSSTVSNWPNSTTGEGFGYRGGGWINGSNFLRVSDRFDADTNISGSTSRIGFRCARTAEI